MKRCKICNVDVDTNNSNCPLCYSELSGKAGKTIESYKPREVVKEQKAKSLAIKILMFISLFVVATCLAINLMADASTLWSIIVVLSLVYIWVLILHTIASKRSTFEKLLLQIGTFIALLFVCEWIAGGGNWMVNYVIPALSILIMFVLFILAQALKYNRGVLSFFIMTIILTALAGVFVLFNIASFLLLNQITLILGTIFILGMVLFNGRVLKTEFSKKFYV